MTQQNSSILKANKSFSSGFTDTDDTIEPSLRSVSANGTSPTYKSFICRTRETKAAFDDVVDDKKTDNASCLHASEDLSHTTSSVLDKENNTETNEAVQTALFQSPQQVANSNVISSVGQIRDTLFSTRSQTYERQKDNQRDKKRTLTVWEVESCEMIKPAKDMESRTSPNAQSPAEITVDNRVKDNDSVVFKEPNPDGQDRMNIRVGKESQVSEDKTGARSRDQHIWKETPLEKTKCDPYLKGNQHLLEQSDTLQLPGLPLPIPQSPEDRWRKSSPASLHSSLGPSALGNPSPSRPRRVSLSATPNGLISSAINSGQTDTTRDLQDDLLGTQQHSSDSKETRRGSQARRSSVAASMLNSDVRDKKKSSNGFSLAASLVKWKLKTLHASKEHGDSIAKDAKHQELMDRTADRIKTELPRPLLVSIQEEAYPILFRTAQAYRSQLGAKHKLTVQANNRLEELARDLERPY